MKQRVSVEFEATEGIHVTKTDLEFPMRNVEGEPIKPRMVAVGIDTGSVTPNSARLTLFLTEAQLRQLKEQL
jgi:hypothetical protein